MAIATKNLASGQLGTTQADIYVCPVATTAVVRSISLVNGGTWYEFVSLYLKPSGGTARKIIPYKTMLGECECLETTGIYTLGAGDSIQGYTNTASTVDYVISGVEEA